MPTFSRLYLQLKDATTNLRMTGEATDQDYRNQIQLSGVSWDMSRGKAEASGGTRGRPEPGEFEFSKVMDRSSTSMLIKMRHGVRLTAVVTLDSPDDSSFKLTITLKNARISSYKMDIKDGEKSGEIKEDWAFTYSEIEVEYKTLEDGVMPTSHKRTKETSSKDAQDSIIASFKALNDAKRIVVSATLKSEYPKLFPN